MKPVFDKFEAAFTARHKITALKSVLGNKDLEDENEGAQGDALLERLVDKMVSY